jgi:CIC family chloride channel protein
VLWCAGIGAASGLIVAGFDWLVEDQMLPALFDLPVWFVAVAPTIGLGLTALTLRYFRAAPSTSDSFIAAFHGREVLGLRHAAPRAIGAVATLGTGGALGLEGPSMFFGASTGAFLQRRFSRLVRGADPKLLLVAGAAAGIAAIFKAPATGAIFALEVPYQDDLARRMLLPALVGAASGYLAFVAVQGTDPLFAVEGAPPFSFPDLLGALVLGVAAGSGARVLSAALRLAKRTAATVAATPRVLAAGAVLGGCLVLGRVVTDENIALGPGGDALRWALAPDRSVGALLAILVIRSIATTSTVAGGGVGSSPSSSQVDASVVRRVSSSRPRMPTSSRCSGSRRSSAPAIARRSRR